jgi:hypothetical protein
MNNYQIKQVIKSRNIKMNKTFKKNLNQKQIYMNKVLIKIIINYKITLKLNN